MEFSLNFNMDNAAFEDFAAGEIERILKAVVVDARSGYTFLSIMDANGNKIGSWEIAE